MERPPHIEKYSKIKMDTVPLVDRSAYSRLQRFAHWILKLESRIEKLERIINEAYSVIEAYYDVDQHLLADAWTDLSDKLDDLDQSFKALEE